MHLSINFVIKNLATYMRLNNLKIKNAIIEENESFVKFI